MLFLEFITKEPRRWREWEREKDRELVLLSPCVCSNYYWLFLCSLCVDAVFSHLFYAMSKSAQLSIMLQHQNDSWFFVHSAENTPDKVKTHGAANSGTHFAASLLCIVMKCNAVTPKQFFFLHSQQKENDFFSLDNDFSLFRSNGALLWEW